MSRLRRAGSFRGSLVSGAACVALGVIFFQIAWWMGIIAVFATFFLALVASRATGETDITPTGAMGKITQLIYGWLAPGNMTTNLMTASLTGGAAIHTADLLTDLKSGYLLGANPRKQLIAQMWGVLAGTLFVVPGYLLLIKPDEIGTDKWPAPAAQVWAGVAKVLAHGLGALPKARAKRCWWGCGRGLLDAHRRARPPRQEEVHDFVGCGGHRVGHPGVEQLFDVSSVPFWPGSSTA